MHIIALLKPHITSWAYFFFYQKIVSFCFYSIIYTFWLFLSPSLSPPRRLPNLGPFAFFSRVVIAAFRAQFFFENLKDRISCQMQRKKDDLLWEFSQVRLQSETEWTEDNEKEKKKEKKRRTHTHEKELTWNRHKSHRRTIIRWIENKYEKFITN